MLTRETVQIVGVEPECSCDCCGRSLKLAARLDDGHVMGVDCLAAATLADRYLGNGRRGWKAVKGSDHRDTLKRLAHAQRTLRGTYPGPTLKVRKPVEARS